MPSHQKSRRRGLFETLEDRRVLAVTLQDFTDAGISTRASDTLLQSEYASTIVNDVILATVLDSLAETQAAPANAVRITNVAGLSQITAGSSTNPNIYLIEGDLTITSNIEVPSNVQIYVDGSIYKAGTHTRTPGQPSENEFDYIFRVRNAQNVKLIGIDNALLHSRATLNDQLGHATAVYVTGNQTNNVSVEGFEIGYVWEGLVARGGPSNVVFSDNYVHDTLKRAIWHLTSKDSVSVHNFVENAGADGMDWDAFVDRSVGYENVVVSAGRWLGFVEEAAEDSAFIRNFGYMVDYGNPNADLYYQLGWVDHGTTPGVASGGNQTQNNYFIDNVVYRPTGFNEGGQYYANQPPKGDTWFWANRGYANGSGLNMNYHGELTLAEWLTFVPDRNLNFEPTVADPGETITALEWLSRLDALYNAEPGIELVAAPMSVSELAAPGTAVGVVVPLGEDPTGIAFEITAGNTSGTFAIDENGVITVTGPLDRDLQPAYSLTVSATDGDRVGSLLVGVGIKAPVGSDTTLFDHGFDSPDFFAGDIRGQNGWTAQDGWEVVDPGGQGETVSSTTAYQGITNTGRADLSVGDVARVEIDFRIDLGAGGASDLFRYGVTTLDSSGSFVPALGNNGGSVVTGKIAYRGTATNVLTIWPDTETMASQVELTAPQIGVDFDSGDRLTDELRITWETEKSATPGVWEASMVITNLDTGTELGRNTIPVTEPISYATGDGLFAGIRGLANSSGSTFRLDRFAFSQATPGAPLPGDYNADGTVDSADYTVYRDQAGQTGAGLAADSDGSGVVDGVDRVTWLSNYGQTLPAEPAGSVANASTTAEPLTASTTESPTPLRGLFISPTRSTSSLPDRSPTTATPQSETTDRALLAYLLTRIPTTAPTEIDELDNELPQLQRDPAEIEPLGPLRAIGSTPDA